MLLSNKQKWRKTVTKSHIQKYIHDSKYDYSIPNNNKKYLEIDDPYNKLKKVRFNIFKDVDFVERYNSYDTFPLLSF